MGYVHKVKLTKDTNKAVRHQRVGLALVVAASFVIVNFISPTANTITTQTFFSISVRSLAFFESFGGVLFVSLFALRETQKPPSGFFSTLRRTPPTL